MYASFLLSALLSIAAVASAAPNPAVTPAPVVRDVNEERGCAFFFLLIRQQQRSPSFVRFRG